MSNVKANRRDQVGNRNARSAVSAILTRRSPTGDPRARSNAQQGTGTGEMTGPLTIDKATGRQTVAVAGALKINERGELDLNVAAPLAQTPGSPVSITLDVDDSLPMDRQGRMTARPFASAVRNDSKATGRTLGDVLAMLFATPNTVAIGALPVGTTAGTVAAGNDSRIAVLGSKVPLTVGTAVLVAGTVVVPHLLVSATSVFIVQHQVFGGTPGLLNVPARVVGVSFTITSANALDTSTVAYSFYEPF